MLPTHTDTCTHTCPDYHKIRRSIGKTTNCDNSELLICKMKTSEEHLRFDVKSINHPPLTSIPSNELVQIPQI